MAACYRGSQVNLLSILSHYAWVHVQSWGIHSVFSGWKMISDYVGFQRYILLEFYLFVIWKEQHLCTLFGLQHSASKFVFQTVCIRTQWLILFTMFYVCLEHLDKAHCIFV